MIDRIWKGSLAVLAEQVVRGVKPIATFAVVDAGPGEISKFLAELSESQPEWVRPLKWSILHQRQTIEIVHLYSHDEIYNAYLDALKLPDGLLRDVTLGYLFGYSTDDIVEYTRPE